MLANDDLIEQRLEAIERLLCMARAETTGEAIENVERWKAEVTAIEEAIERRECESPASWLGSRLGLSACEQRVLWLLAGCEIVPKIRLMTRALATESLLDPTVDVVRRVAYGDARARGWEDLGRRGALMTYRLVERTDDGARTPPARQTLRIAPRVLDLIYGSTAIDGELAELARHREVVDGVERLVLADGVIASARDAFARPAPNLIVAIGSAGMGRASVLAGCAGDVIEIEASRLAKEPERLGEQLRAIARECRLLDRTLLIREIGELSDGDRLAIVDREIVATSDRHVLATARAPVSFRWSRPAIAVAIAPISEAQRAAVWRVALPEAPVDATAALAARFPIPPARIHAAAGAARAQGGQLGSAAIARGVRSVIDDRLAGLATRVDVTQSWDDLVLDDDQLAPIVELIARIKHRGKVYEQWGFGKKLARGLGVSALFSGPPGTGKTMVAGLIARSLGLELYQVDLAKMVSKWIGETEKNLAAVFDAAEAGHAVLLFDEADSLFAKRTHVASSNDRYANLEVNYLLQRVESFTGICVLTTNNDGAIDDAFRRRLSLHLRFAVPEVDERERIWRAVIPAAAETSHDLDLRALAERFDMAGGYIRNAALRAAFLAADDGTAISTAHLMRAAIQEYEGMGKIAPGTGRVLSLAAIR